MTRTDLHFSLACIALTLPLYCFTAAPGITLSDSGEFVTAVYKLGIPHPPGNPTYVLLGYLFSLLPLGVSAARQMNLFSALCVALTVGVSYLLTSSLFPSVDRWMALAGSIALGYSLALWSWAVLTEVYALNVLLVALMLLCAARGAWVLGALVVGMALGVHHATVAMAIIPAIALAWTRQKPTAKTLGLSLLAGLAGLSVYLYLPIRGAQRPLYAWGDLNSLQGLWWHLSGGYYRAMPAVAGRRGVLSHLTHVPLYGEHFIRQLAPLGVLVALWGWIVAGWKRRAVFFVSIALVALNLGFIVATDLGGVDLTGYYLPGFLTFAWMFAIGAQSVFDLSKIGKRSAIALALVVAFSGAVVNFHLNNHRQDRVAELYVQNTLQDVPSGSLLLTADWNFYAPWMAMHHVDGYAPGVKVVFTGMLAQRWYLRSLARDYPELFICAGGRKTITADKFIEGLVACEIGKSRVFYTMKIERNFLNQVNVIPHGVVYEYFWQHPDVQLDLAGLFGEVPDDDNMDFVKRTYANMLTARAKWLAQRGGVAEARWKLDRALRLYPGFRPAMGLRSQLQ